ncbi:MAG: nucleoid-associated protein [Pseudomonadota bacterium]
MKLIKLIVHAIDKTPDAGESQLNLSQQDMQGSDSLINFLTDLNSSFNSKLAKTHGAFVTSENTDSTSDSGFEEHGFEEDGSKEQQTNLFYSGLKDYLQGNLPFVDFSHQSMAYLKTLMDRNGKTKGGYIVFAHYQLFASDFLFVVILHNQAALVIDEQLQLNQTEYLDTRSLYLASRIDLSEWQDTSSEKNDRYISMLIARDGKKINDYFREFIGFNETVDSKKETSQLLGAFSGFCEQSKLDSEVKDELKKKAVDYCSKQAETGENVQVKDFSNYVSEMAEEDFYRYLKNEQIDLKDEVTPDRGLLRKFNKLSGRSGNLSITFPASLFNQSVFYDSETDTLTIKNLPKSLRQQLLAITPSQKTSSD